ncbi:MAG TPA: cytochrome c maturation protein CcmE [Candidatus Saccharimonadales bacterium]|nr:cytochrome c maturation protein CcmE [Candidatus Saccharimonadales bacterium]
MKLTHVLGLALVLGGLLAGLTVYQKSLTPYRSFKEARETRGTVQVHGTLAPASAKYDGRELTFRIKDTRSADEMEVVYTDVKPGNFDQARDIVAIGSFRDGAFHAEKLLVKCPSKYQELQEKQNQAARSPAA